MNVRRVFVFVVILFGLSLVLGDFGDWERRTAVRPDRSAPPRLDLSRLPLTLEATTGQGEDPAIFVARGANYSLRLEPSTAFMMLNRAGSDSPAVLTIGLEGAAPSLRMTAEEKLVGVSHYFLGSDSSLWRTNVPQYARVRAVDVYQGFDLVNYSNRSELEFDLIVKPGGDPSQIVLALEGTQGIKIDERGDLIADLGGGDVRLRSPESIRAARKSVKNRRRVCRLDLNRVGVGVDNYDSSRTLVNDQVIVCATKIGSGDYEMAEIVAVNGAGASSCKARRNRRASGGQCLSAERSGRVLRRSRLQAQSRRKCSPVLDLFRRLGEGYGIGNRRGQGRRRLLVGRYGRRRTSRS